MTRDLSDPAVPFARAASRKEAANRAATERRRLRAQNPSPWQFVLTGIVLGVSASFMRESEAQAAFMILAGTAVLHLAYALRIFLKRRGGRARER